MANLEINTTQNVNLDYKIASVGERILAILIDLSLFSLYLYIVNFITGAVGNSLSDSWTVFGLYQLLLLPIFFYSLYMHILFNGRTIGKMVLKIKVVPATGGAIHWSQYLILWMLRLVDIWLFFASVGILTILFTEKRQRLGDLAAATVVISTKRKVAIHHTLLEDISEAYQPTFSVVTNLTDKDVRLIKETYLAAVASRDFKTLNALRVKVEEVLGVSSPLYDKQFIDTVLKDYNHYTQHM
ncbi:MAG: hypothetical protein CMC08_01580 [Flavobacteriaceae bacterium]|nr:hypothetical protein [Flavobacteriaceae bacterium]